MEFKINKMLIIMIRCSKNNKMDNNNNLLKSNLNIWQLHFLIQSYNSHKLHNWGLISSVKLPESQQSSKSMKSSSSKITHTSLKVKHSILHNTWQEIFSIYKPHSISESISSNCMLISKMLDWWIQLNVIIICWPINQVSSEKESHLTDLQKKEVEVGLILDWNNKQEWINLSLLWPESH